MRTADFLTLCKAEGISVDVIGNPEAHVRPGSFTPFGQIVHHTGDKGRGDSGLSILIYGRDLGKPTELHGPLCTGSPRENGRLAYISAGRANHAGSGSGMVLDRVKHDLPPLGLARDYGLHDDTTGNGFFYGWEVDNDGVGQPYPPEQIDTVIRICTMTSRFHNWSANRTILHSEWTARKVDWSLPAAPLRAAIKHRLENTRLVRGLWVFADAAPPAPVVKPAPAPVVVPQSPEDDMQVLMKTPTDPAVFITDGVTKRHVTSQAELQVLLSSGLVKLPIAQVSPEILAAIPTVGA